MKTLKDYIDEILAEDSNLPTPNDSSSPLSKTKKSDPYHDVNREVSDDDEKPADKKKTK